MPSPIQLREERIYKLVDEFTGKDVVTMEPILKKAIELFSNDVSKKTIESYAVAAVRILKARKKTKKKGG